MSGSHSGVAIVISFALTSLLCVEVGGWNHPCETGLCLQQVVH